MSASRHTPLFCLHTYVYTPHTHNVTHITHAHVFASLHVYIHVGACLQVYECVLVDCMFRMRHLCIIITQDFTSCRPFLDWVIVNQVYLIQSLFQADPWAKLVVQREQPVTQASWRCRTPPSQAKILIPATPSVPLVRPLLNKILWSDDLAESQTARLCVYVCIGCAAAEAPDKFQSGAIILIPYVAASRLRKIWQ